MPQRFGGYSGATPGPVGQAYGLPAMRGGLGDLLAQQAQTETEEMRRKRLQQMQGLETYSPAGRALFGS